MEVNVSSPNLTGDSAILDKPGLLHRRLPEIAYMCITAFLLRFAAMFVVPHNNIWSSAGEAGNIARSMVAGQGFSSPFSQPTGPTAWVPPGYPGVLAVIFEVFGVFSRESMMATLLFQLTVSALTCIPIFKIAQELGNRKLGVWAGWCWACYPYFVLLPVLFIWDTSLAALLLSCVLCMTVTLNRPRGLVYWGLFGALWGIASLTDTALLALVPVCGGWLWWRRRGTPPKEMLQGAVLASLVFVVIVGPWCWRNWRTFHTFIPVRSSFGENLWLGNHEGGRGRFSGGENANENPRELRRFQGLGEIAYARMRKQAAFDYIRREPEHFVRNVIYRTLYWWFAVGEHSAIFVFYMALGLGTLAGTFVIFRARDRGWCLMALSVLVFPVTYYIVDVLPRYRHPVEPAMTLTATYFVAKIAPRRKCSGQSLE